MALAELLSTTRESVARNLSLLEKQGLLIRRDRWHCQLADPQLVDVALQPTRPALIATSAAP
ncbi:hypothetical protein Y695_01420 [Hydrogenophaga sp. T4]|nr:hypothetical protein Y695_01420 [Hydrogenophaga sp. T4]